MTKYKLIKYGLGIEEEEVFESFKLGDAVLAGITLSHEDAEHIGFYTYRLEKWIDYKLQMGFRYFNNGRDVTDEFRAAILGSILPTYSQ